MHGSAYAGNGSAHSFTKDQQAAFDALCGGQNVFLSGEAGTGKSFVADAFIEWCEENNRKVLAAAPTGIAALNLRNGSTIRLKRDARFGQPSSRRGRKSVRWRICLR